MQFYFDTLGLTNTRVRVDHHNLLQSCVIQQPWSSWSWLIRRFMSSVVKRLNHRDTVERSTVPSPSPAQISAAVAFAVSPTFYLQKAKYHPNSRFIVTHVYVSCSELSNDIISPLWPWYSTLGAVEYRSLFAVVSVAIMVQNLWDSLGLVSQNRHKVKLNVIELLSPTEAWL